MKPDKPPFVSVITPVYNGEAFLAEALESVQQQHYQPLEIIIIDDGSTDGSARIAKSFKSGVRYVYQSNRGPAAARNTGLEIAQGEIVAFLDVDDRWAKHTLHRQLDCLMAKPNVDIVQGLIQDMRAEAYSNDTKPIFKAVGQPYSFVNLGSAIYRKTVFNKVGLFDETMRFDEDTDWFIRAWECRISKIILNQVSLYYRKHAENMTNGVEITKQTGFVRLFKKHLDRQRTQGHQPAVPGSNLPSLTDYIGWSEENRRKK